MVHNILHTLHRLGIETKRRGALYVALCPFHQDKETPSLTIYPRTQSWFCFGNCDSKGGDSISFVMRYLDIGYKEALEWLGEEIEVGEPELAFNIKAKIVPPEAVIYWHSLLGEHRAFFYERGFGDDIINSELWGWDGDRYTIPVWEGSPGNSNCLGVRKRRSKNEGFKYIGLKNMNPATVWGRWHCRNSELIYAFAGELDAALAVQDGLPAFSVVNGVSSFEAFPQNWPNMWFPNSKKLIVIFDRGEEAIAGKFASVWNSYKGSMTARVSMWPEENALLSTSLMDLHKYKIKDYCEFRQHFTFARFREMLSIQFGETYENRGI